MLKRFRDHLAGAAFGVAVALVGASYANVTGLVPLTGPQDPSQLNATINTLINNLNAQITGFIAFSGATAELGEMQISGNANTWAANGTAATTMTSLGPQGAHTTVQEWLVVFDTNGFLRFIPAY